MLGRTIPPSGLDAYRAGIIKTDLAPGNGELANNYTLPKLPILDVQEFAHYINDLMDNMTVANPGETEQRLEVYTPPDAAGDVDLVIINSRDSLISPSHEDNKALLSGAIRNMAWRGDRPLVQVYTSSSNSSPTPRSPTKPLFNQLSEKDMRPKGVFFSGPSARFATDFAKILPPNELETFHATTDSTLDSLWMTSNLRQNSTHADSHLIDSSNIDKLAIALNYDVEANGIAPLVTPNTPKLLPQATGVTNKRLLKSFRKVQSIHPEVSLSVYDTEGYKHPDTLLRVLGNKSIACTLYTPFGKQMSSFMSGLAIINAINQE